MADAYERQYMQGSGAILHRQKVHTPAWVVALTALLPATALAVMGLTAGGAAMLPFLGGAALYATLMGGLMIALAGGRIAVSEGELHVQIGPFGPKIPIASIATCEVGPSGLRSYGLGAQKLLDGTTIYKLLGDNARSALLTLRDGRKIVIVCPDGPALVAAVNEAMQRQATPKTRVASELELESESESEHAADADADAAPARTERTRR